MSLISALRGRGARPGSASRKRVTLLACAAALGAFVWQGPALLSVADPAGAPGTNPLGQLRRTVVDATPITGHVEERMPAGSYTYFAVRSGETLTWAVTVGDVPPPGARVQVRSLGRRTSFHSRRLGRTFPELVFGVVSLAD